MTRPFSRFRAAETKLKDFPISFPAQKQYNAQKAGITSAIVIAVLIPVACLGICLVAKLRQVAADRNEEVGGYGVAGGGGDR